MHPIYLHGPPASGKRTVAHALGQLTGISLLENLVTIDVALSVVEFDAPEFWNLVPGGRMTK